MESFTPVPLESILLTEELNWRPTRPPDFEAENKALERLVEALSDSPETILQTLAETVLDVLQCGSAGISLLSTDDGGKRFYWPAIAGTWKSHIGEGTPRDFGPCGDVLDRDTALLFSHVERRYTYFQPVRPLVEEALLVPFYSQGKAIGTIWAVSHDARKFDGEDKRRLLSLARFASAAYQTVTSFDSSRLLATIVECSDDAIISKNLNGVISSWNKSAERIFGYKAVEAIGQHITLIVPPNRLEEEKGIIESLRRGERVDHFETVRQRKDGTKLDISLTISPVRDSTGRVVGASKVARDISEQKRVDGIAKIAERTAYLLQVQDEEKRRIARELHDGVGQLLAAVGMNIGQVLREKEKLSEPAARSAQEISTLLARASDEIRTASYLLHPPLLDEMGLPTVLEWFANGFADRSKIKVSVGISPDLPRLSPNCELGLFRIAQECLTNIHRHSSSLTASVELSRAGGNIELKVSDQGKGIKQELQAQINSGLGGGVGFRGMQERVRLIGGNLLIHSVGQGTSIVITLPLNQKTLAAGDNQEFPLTDSRSNGAQA